VPTKSMAFGNCLSRKSSVGSACVGFGGVGFENTTKRCKQSDTLSRWQTTKTLARSVCLSRKFGFIPVTWGVGAPHFQNTTKHTQGG